MPVLVDRIEDTKVNCLIWVGRVSKSEALGMPARIDPSRSKFGRCWISYFDSTADLSDLDAATLVELRERLRPVVCRLAAQGEFKMILASNSIFIDPLLAAWRAMVATDADYPSNPVHVRSIDSASQALGLSAEDARQARTWIESRVEEVSGVSR